jgi:hypothetical protein
MMLSQSETVVLLVVVASLAAGNGSTPEARHQRDWDYKTWTHDVRQSNLIYVRPPKTASTTFASVTKRIADHNGLAAALNSTWDFRDMCPHAHGRALLERHATLSKLELQLTCPFKN